MKDTKKDSQKKKQSIEIQPKKEKSLKPDLLDFRSACKFEEPTEDEPYKILGISFDPDRLTDKERKKFDNFKVKHGIYIRARSSAFV